MTSQRESQSTGSLEITLKIGWYWQRGPKGVWSWLANRRSYLFYRRGNLSRPILKQHALDVLQSRHRDCCWFHRRRHLHPQRERGRHDGRSRQLLLWKENKGWQIISAALQHEAEERGRDRHYQREGLGNRKMFSWPHWEGVLKNSYSGGLPIVVRRRQPDKYVFVYSWEGNHLQEVGRA